MTGYLVYLAQAEWPIFHIAWLEAGWKKPKDKIKGRSKQDFETEDGWQLD